MLSDLPMDLAEEVVSRIPVTSLRGVRSTCKKWKTLCKDGTFTRRHIRREEAKKKQRKEFQVVMMLDYRVSLFRVNLLLYPFIERVGKLISLDDADRVDISHIFHCHGLLLCITKDLSRLVVWNPCSGQTLSLQPRNSFSKLDKYALGYDMNNKHHKVLRFLDHHDWHRSPHLREFEVYNLYSNSWKVLDVNPDWDVDGFHHGLSLHGNTYWFARDKKPLGDHSYFLLCFDFTTETFGLRLRLPFHPFYRDTVCLSSVGENQLAVLFQRISPPYTLRIWITSKIEPNAVSWNKLFLKVDMKPITGFPFCCMTGSFFVDKKKKVAVVVDKDRDTFTPTRNIAYIIGNKGSLKKVELGESTHQDCWPLVCSYVPSSVQINQKTP